MAGDDFGAQTERAFLNVLEALKAAGASQQNVVKLTINIVQGHDINLGFAAAQNVWGMHPTAISVLIVAGLANPQALVEIDAVAAIEA
jgi:enamine deaminase RidA (YjgF/YER057c/UK114 family)